MIKAARDIDDLLKVTDEFYLNDISDDIPDTGLDSDLESASSKTSGGASQVDLELSTASKQAFDDQVLGKLFYSLDVPKLETLEQLLDGDIIKSDSLSHARHLHSQLLALARRLEQRIKGSAGSIQPPTPTPDSMAPLPSQLGKRRREDNILPASPEKKQVRKKSYGIH